MSASRLAADCCSATITGSLTATGTLPTEKPAQLEELTASHCSEGLFDDDMAMLQELRPFGEFEHHTSVPEGT